MASFYEDRNTRGDRERLSPSAAKRLLFSGVETDTRVIGRDALFVAFKGERF